MRIWPRATTRSRPVRRFERRNFRFGDLIDAPAADEAMAALRGAETSSHDHRLARRRSAGFSGSPPFDPVPTLIRAHCVPVPQGRLG